MFKAYSDILSYPGAVKFSLAGAIARFPMSMQSLSVLLMVSAVYSHYATAGQVNAALTIAFAVGNPFLARWSDRHGQAKIMRPATTIYCLGICLLIWAIMTRQSPWLLYALAVVTGACGGSFGAFVRTRWAKTLAAVPRKMNTAFAFEAALDEVLFIIGPILATVLVTSVHPAAGLGACLFCSLAGSFWFLSQKATEPKPRPHKELDADEKRSLLRSGAMLVLCLIYMSCGLAIGAIDLSVVAFCREIGAPGISGALLAIIGAGSLTSALIYGSREWPLSALRLFAGGILLMAVAFSTFFFAHNVPLLALSLVFFGITYAPTMTNTVNLLQLIVQPTRFTEGMAWFNTSFTVGLSIGSWIGGHMIDRHGSHAGFMTTVFISWGMLVVVVLSLRLLRNSLRKARKRRQAKVERRLGLTENQD